MTTTERIWPRQIFSAAVEGADKDILMKVQGFSVTGHAVLSPVGSRKIAVPISPDVLLRGGVVETGGPLGTLVFSPAVGGTVDKKV